jgi:hypothetical protein
MRQLIVFLICSTIGVVAAAQQAPASTAAPAGPAPPSAPSLTIDMDRAISSWWRACSPFPGSRSTSRSTIGTRKHSTPI